MRRPLVHEFASRLSYEIREIVPAARSLGIPVLWENIGDPIQKGEPFPAWMKEIVAGLVLQDSTYAYSDTQGLETARECIARKTNGRGGCTVRSDDILFFNGLGDAVTTVFGLLSSTARVLGPSPAYSSHSSAEAVHSGDRHLTYTLDPANGWRIDPEEIEYTVKTNDSVSGILVINPDNPTGAVHSRETLEHVVDIASRYGLFLIFDETYGNIVYNGAAPVFLSEVIGDVPGISMRSISKEYPWPGGRCGWIEVYNSGMNADFAAYIESLHAAKRLEVCSTTLPQLSIPYIMDDERYTLHLQERADRFGRRAREVYRMLHGIDGIRVTLPQGALYFTVLFEDGALNGNQRLPAGSGKSREVIERLTAAAPLDKRFVYYLLAGTGICVVPLSGFCSTLYGFRMTLLEHDDDRRREICTRLAEAVQAYLRS
ncbi:MAG: pyridoxal phosphate-dependent aminotransferase [Spirochaetota bacterium]